MARKLFTREMDGILPSWLTDEQKERCYCDDRGWVLVHPDGSEEVIVAGHRYNDPAERGHGFDAQRRSKDPDRAAAHGELSYTLTPSKTTVGEGDSVSVQLVATGVPDETLIAYTIEGIDPEDLDNGLLSGEFQIFGETATIEIPIKADRTTETLETFTLKLADGLGSVQINIDDLSKTPIYNLSSNPQSPVDEGDSLQIILETENVDDGLVAYSVEGVDELDIERGSSEILTVKVEQNLQEPFNNVFNISGNQYPNLKLFQGHTYTLNQDDDTNSFHPLLFSETNGGAEYTEGVTYYLDGIQVQNSSAYTSGFFAASSREIKISVTENTPNTLYYYCLYHNNMGSSVSILEDSAPLAGNFSLVNGYASLVFNIKKDQLTEETAEKLILRLSDNLGTIEVDINDTSKTPSYSLSTENNITEFDEGSPIVVNLSTTNVEPGTLIPYEISGSSNLAEDFDPPFTSSTGTFIVGEDETLTFNVKGDKSWGEGDKTLRVELTGLGKSVFVIIRDSSIADPVYELVADKTSVNENESFQITLNATNVPANTQIGYTLSGSSDLNTDFDEVMSETGTFTVGHDTQANSSDSITFNVKDDKTWTSEGDETLILTLDGGLGTITVNIVDSSIADPVYELIAPQSSSENSSFQITLNATNVPANTQIGYTLSGSVNLNTDFDEVMSETGTFTVGSDTQENSSDSITFNVKDDKTWAEGDENLILTLDGGLGTVTVNITDSSIAGSSYELVANPVNVNEGEALTITLNANNVPANTQIGYTLSGSVNLNTDFDEVVPSSGSFTVGSDTQENSSDSITFNVKDDKTWAEGDENLILTLDGGLGTVTVNITDSSIADPVYELIADKTSVNENESFEITLNATNVPANTQIGYTLSGSANLNTDFDEVMSETGTFTVGSDTQANSSDSLTFNVRSDSSFEEGDEELTLTLDGGLGTVTVSITDSSRAIPTFGLSSNPLSQASEGGPLTISLTYQNVSVGTEISYNLTGSTVDLNTDFDPPVSNTGKFIIGQQEEVTFNIVADESFEEGNEVLKLTLDNGKASIQVPIIDSSTATPSYNLSTQGNVTFVNENDSVTISLGYQNLSVGTEVPYTIGGDVELNDFTPPLESYNGKFVIGDPLTEKVDFFLADDKTFDEGDETLTLTLNVDGVNEAKSILVKDTSKETEVYGLSAPASTNENASFNISLNTQFVTAGTEVPYTLSGNYEPEDFNPPLTSSTGTFIVGEDETLTLSVADDKTWGENNESLTLTLDGKGISAEVDIVDSSIADSVYELVASPANVNEGEALTITLNATNVPANTTIGYSIDAVGGGISLTDDFDSPVSSTGSFTVGHDTLANSSDSITFNLKEDKLTETSAESLILTLDGGLGSVTVPIADTSKTEIFTLESSAVNDTIGEGGDPLVITLTTQNVPDGTYAYTIQGIDESDLNLANSDQLQGSFVLVEGTDTITLDIKADAFTEIPNDVIDLSLENGKASIQITVEDTSKTPSYDLTATPEISVNEGSPLRIDLSTENVVGNAVAYKVTGINEDDLDDGSSDIEGNFSLDSNGDSYVVFNIKADKTTEDNPEDVLVLTLTGLGESINVNINDISKTEIWNLSTSPADSVDEDGDLVITLQTQNVDAGTYAYTISGSGFGPEDLKPESDELEGFFTITGATNDVSSDSITLKIKKDYSSNEGDEKITISLDNGKASLEVDVIDTSNSGSVSDGELPSSDENLTLPSISDDAQYAALGNTVSGDGKVEIFKYDDSSGWALHQTLPKPVPDTNNAHGMATSFNSDGSVLAVGDGWANGYRGRVFIYRRGDDGQLALEHTIDNPDNNMNTYFGHGVALSGDGNSLFVVHTQSRKIYRYDYNLNSEEWSSAPNYTLSTTVQYRDIDVSPDGMMLAAAGGHGAPHEARIWTWNNTSFEDHSSVSMPTSNPTMSVSISNKKLLAVGQVGKNNSENKVTLFDLDGTTWNPRPLESWQTSGYSNSNWTNNQGFKVALSEPKDNGKVLLIDFGGEMYELLPSAGTYTIWGPFRVNEDRQLTLALFALGIDGDIPYTIEGITDADLDIAGGSASTDGVFQVSDSVGAINLKLKEDSDSLDGSLTITLDNGGASKTVIIKDITPIYNLSSSPQFSVDEGATLRIELQTTNVSETSIPYSVQGIQAADLVDGSAPLTGGSFSLDGNGYGFIDFLIKEDKITEDNPEDVLVLTLDGDLGTISVNINDTSKTPIWNLSTSPVGNVNEGVDLLITLQTQNVDAGDYAYDITGTTGFGPEDLDAGSDPLSGNFTVSSSPSSQTLTLKIKKDYTSDETAETITISLPTVDEVDDIDVIINDSSTLNPTEGGRIGQSLHYPTISGDGQYVTLTGISNGSLPFWKYDSASGLWASIGSVATPRSTGYYNGHGGGSFNGDGSLLAIGSPRSTQNGVGYVDIYERNGETFTLRETITGSTPRFGFGVALSDDGLTLVSHDYITKENETFEWSNNQWNLVDTKNVGIQSYGQIDISDDGQRLVVASMSNIVKIYDRNGTGWDHTHTITSSRSTIDIYGVQITNNGNTVMFGDNGYQVQNELEIWDYDGTNWNQRDSNIIAPDWTYGVGHNRFIYTAASEPNNGTITLVSTRGYIYNIPASTDKYSISGPSSVDEGQDLTLTLSALIPNGDVPYTISGIADSDLRAGSDLTSGNFNIVNETASITLKLKEDADGLDGSLTITVDQGGDYEKSKTVIIKDISPIYELSSNPQFSVDEGATLRIELQTTNVSETSIPYTVQGIQPEDLVDGSALLTGGSFSLDSNGYGYLDFLIKEDKITEDNPEDVLVLTLDGDLGTISVNINDTSKTPIWELTTSPAGNVDEGDDLLITLNTQNVDAGDYAYNISGSGFGPEDLEDDSDPLTGVFTITGATNDISSDSITLKIKKDYSTGEGDETITISLPTVDEVDDIDVVINDSSTLDPQAGPRIGDSSSWYPTISPNGEHAVLHGRYTTELQFYRNVDGNWTYTGSLHTDGDQNDKGKPYYPGLGSGSFTLDGSLFVNGLPSRVGTEGQVEIYQKGSDGNFSLRERISSPLTGTSGRNFGLGVAISGDGLTLVVHDYSGRLYTYRWEEVSGTFQWVEVDESSTSGYNSYGQIDMTADAQTLVIPQNPSSGYPSKVAIFERDGQGWKFQQEVLTSPDIGMSRSVQISSDGQRMALGSAGFSGKESQLVLFDYDGTNWVQRDGTLVAPTTIDNNYSNRFNYMSMTDSIDGIMTLISTGGHMYYIPESTDKYSISGPSSIDEGQDLTLTLSALVPNGYVPYTITGITDADLRAGSDLTSGNFNVANETASITLKLKEDIDPHDGSLTITVDQGGEDEASKTVIIKDITPIYDLTSSPQISVNEGVSLRIELQTTNVSETSIPYTVQGIQAADLDTGSDALTGGSFNLNPSGYGYLDFHIIADKVTEGDENLVLTLDGGLGTISVNVVDSSKEPIWELTTSPATLVNEGSDLLITLNTQNVDAGNYAYDISGSGFGPEDLEDDSDPLTGNFTVSGSPSSDSITLKIKKDYSSGEGDETITISLPTVDEVDNVTLTVNDTSNVDATEGPSLGTDITSRYPAISNDGIYAATVGGSHSGNNVRFYKYENSSWNLTQTLTYNDPGTNIDGYGSCSMSDDGSIFMYCDPYANSKLSIIRVFVRGVDGQYTLRDTFTPSPGGHMGVWGAGLSGDGQTIVAGGVNSSNIITFEYSNGTWNAVDTLSGIIGPLQIDVSSDGQRFVCGNGLGGTPNSGFYIYKRNGNSWSQETFQPVAALSGTNAATWGVAFSKDANFVAVATGGSSVSPSRIFFFDYDSDSNSWVQRSGVIADPDSQKSSYFNYGRNIALSEENNGQITLITTDGATFSIPASLDTYTMIAPSSVDEGQDLTITLNTLGINGDIPYTISGINDADLDIAGGSASTNGVFQVANDTGSITLKILEDADGLDGSLTITVDQGGENEASKTVIIKDITPIYDLSSNPQISVNEGVSLRIELQTTNVSETSIPYTVDVQNIQPEDFDTGSALLTGGSFSLDSNGYGYLDFNIIADKVTEGDENLILTLDGGLGTISINVVDTSKEPIWELTTGQSSPINEGTNLMVTLQTQNVDAGNYAYDISGSGFGPEDLEDDSDPLTGNFTVSGSPSSDSITLKIKKDYSSGEGDETITISLPTVDEVDDIDVVIKDSSSVDAAQNPPVNVLTYSTALDTKSNSTVMAVSSRSWKKLNTYDLVDGTWVHHKTITGSGTKFAETVAVSDDKEIVIGGDTWINSRLGQAYLYKFNNSIDDYELHQTIDPPAYVPGGMFGYGFSISQDKSTITIGESSAGNCQIYKLNPNTDEYEHFQTLTEGGQYSSSLSADGSIFLGGNHSDAGYGGGIVRCKLNSITNIYEEEGGISYGDPDMTTSGTGSVQLGWVVDLSPDGNMAVAGASNETMIWVFDWNSEQSKFVQRQTITSPDGSNYFGRNGLAIDDHPTDSNLLRIAVHNNGNDQIYTYDIMKTISTYSISGPDSVDEGQDLTLTLNTLGINGDIAYTISGITDADLRAGSDLTSGNFNVANDTGSITLKLLEDADLVPESLTITVDQGGENEASKTVTINDITKSYILTATNSLNGAIDEGEPLTINLSTVNVSGPVPYEVTGNYEPEDFDTGSDPLSGEFTLDENGQSSVTFNIKADETTDGPESLTLTLTGTGADPINITINDTSIEPTTEVGVVRNYGGVPAISGDSTVMATYVFDGATNTGSTSKGHVNLFNRNPSTNEIDTTPFTTIYPPNRGNETDQTEFGRQNVSLNNDGKIVAVGATGHESGKVYIYKQNDNNPSYDLWRIISAPESTKFGFCSLSGDGNTLVVGSSGNNKVYTYEYNTGTGDWDRDTSAEFVLPANLSSVSISNTKNSLIVGSKSTNSVYTYDWNESNSSWDLRNGGLLNLQSEGYGNGLWGNMLSLTNDGNTMALSSESSTFTWHVWDWDSTNFQWVNRIVGYEDNSGSYNPLGNYLGASAVNDGVITLAISWKRNNNAEVRLVNIPQNPS